MARICPLFSGSTGNCTYIGSAREGVLVDVGVSAKRIDTALREREIDPASIRAVLLTHEHSDHIAGLKVLSKRYGWTVCGTAGTLQAIAEVDGVAPHTPLLPITGAVRAGGITCTPFATSHDSRESCGYLIDLPDERRVAVLTDTGMLTPAMKQAVRGCDYLYIESNYDPDLLWRGPYPYYLKQRIAANTGHLPNETTASLLPELVKSGTTRITLAHLSAENNLPSLAFNTASVMLAAQGMTAGVDYLLNVASPESHEKVTVF